MMKLIIVNSHHRTTKERVQLSSVFIRKFMASIASVLCWCADSALDDAVQVLADVLL